MLRADLLNALAGQLDELQSLVKWVLAFAFVATILAIQGDDPISVLNLSLTRVQAFFVIAILYIATCTAALAHFRRLTALMACLAPKEIMIGFGKLEAHKWLLNPFVIERLNAKRTSHGAIALTVLVCLFWLSLASLYALLPREAFRAPLAIIFEYGWRSRTAWAQVGSIFAYMAPVGLFAVIGDFALSTVLQMVAGTADRVPSHQMEFKERLQRYAADLKKVADLGIAIGGMVLLIVMILAFVIS